MKDDEYLALRKEAQSLGKNSPESAITFLKSKLDATLKDLLAIDTLLGEQYALSDMHEAQEERLRFGTRLCPDEPLAWTSLTEFMIFTKGDLDEAERAAQQALIRAKKTGEYIRLCHNNFARIARKREDYKTLEECLRFLIDYQPQNGKRDIQYEKDFLAGIDETKIEAGLLVKYNDLCGTTTKDR